MWIAIGFVILLVAGYLFLVFPAPINRTVFKKLSRRSYAHRGYHDNESGPPENTLSAFRAAVEHGYGIELDVQLTKDKQLVVFHDLDLKRAAGIDKRVRDVDYEELKSIGIFNSEETIPLFTEVLAAVDGKAPLLVELKSDGDRLWADEVCRITSEQLRAYQGDFGVQSFDPFMVRWFALSAPEMTRGQLVMGTKWYTSKLSKREGILASSLIINVICRPNFISYKYDDRNFALKIAKFLGAMSFMWTVRSLEDQLNLEKSEDAIIFEGYAPKPKW